MTFKNDLQTLQTVQRITNEIYKKARDTVPDMDWISLYSPQPKVIERHNYGGNVLGRQNTGDDQIGKGTLLLVGFRMCSTTDAGRQSPLSVPDG